MTHSFVYFARDPQSGRIKIGCTSYLRNRMRALSRAVGCDIELLAHVAGDRGIEDRFHALLIELHEGGEWFRPSPRLDAVIVGVNEGWLDPTRLPDVGSPIRKASALRGWADRRARLAA